MNKLFTEFENENVLRVYPFASGCSITDTNGVGFGTGVLIDAALYPVNSTGELYMSSIEPGGIVNISDDTGVIMVATLEAGSSSLEFYDLSGMNRHVGTMLAASPEALSSHVTVDSERKFKKAHSLIASSCVFPVVNDGVTSLCISDLGPTDGDVSFSNGPDDDIRVSTNGSNLRFDVIPRIETLVPNSIKHVYCIVDGATPFRIQKIPFGYNLTDEFAIGNTVAVYLDNIDRDDICGNKHREDALEMADACKECSESSCHKDPIPPEPIPKVYQVEVVDVPNGAENAFYLAVPNFTGYNNPISITMTDGEPAPKLEIKIDEPTDSLEKLEDEMTAKGVIIQIPGLEK